jgi:hypothetical protein
MGHTFKGEKKGKYSMTRMTDDEALTLVRTADSKAAEYCGVLIEASEESLAYYEGLPFGDEVEGRSQLISTDVQDVIEDDMPNIVNTLLSSENIMKFEPKSVNPDAQKEAKKKTDYINWLIRHQSTSYMTLFGWFKDALIQKLSVVTYYVEDTVKVKEPTIQNISLQEIEEKQKTLDNDPEVEDHSITSSVDNEDGTFDVTFKIKTGKQEFKIEKIPFEDFRVSRYTGSDINDAELVGHDEILTRGELLAQGYSKDLIKKLQRTTQQMRNNKKSDLKDIRFYDQNNGNLQDTKGGAVEDWANQEILVHNRYVKLDVDGDGIAERRYFRYSGENTLDNEPFDHVPYAPLSAIPMPDKLIGKSRADLVLQTQRAKSVLLRAGMDNTVMVGNPRTAVNENVNYDDLLDVEFNGIIRTTGDSNPGQNIFPVNTTPIAAETMQMMTFLDSQLTNRTGAMASVQGLNSDSLNQETATRFEGVENSGLRKVQLIVRNFAEGGIRKLYEGVEWMTRHYQNDEVEILIAGEPLKVNPSEWKYEHSIVSEVGLAISDNEESVGALAAISNDQLQLQAQGSPLVDNSKIYNVKAKLVKASGLGSPSEFYNNPDEPRELVNFQNEQLNQMVLQLQQMTEQQQEQIRRLQALSEVELIKAQSKAQADNKKAALDVAKLNENQRQFDISTTQDANQHRIDTSVDITKLELENQKDLEGGL